MHDTHLVVGAGPVGSKVARRLADDGHHVTVVTRSGSGPAHPLIERVSADAANASRMRQLGSGAAAIYNCVNPTYTRWDADWPPIADSLLQSAQETGAVLATVGNLYGYGRVDGPMSQQTPLAPAEHKGAVRVQMWQDALAAHQAGRARVVEVRGSDYADGGVNSHLSRHAPAVLAGKGVWVLGAADQLHSWTATADVAALIVAAGADPTSHGRAWIVPSAPPRTQRQALTDLAERADVQAPAVRVLGPRALRMAGVVSPMMRELAGTAYQFTAPFVVDDTATRAHFGMQPQAWADTLRAVLATARGNDSAAVA